MGHDKKFSELTPKLYYRDAHSGGGGEKLKEERSRMGGEKLKGKRRGAESEGEKRSRRGGGEKLKGG